MERIKKVLSDMCISLDLNKLEELWNKAKEWGVFKHIQKLPDMLCHPRLFWQEYQLLSARDKVIQFSTYAGMLGSRLMQVGFHARKFLGSVALLVPAQVRA